MNIIKCKEHYFDSINRVFSKRNLAINPTDISSYFDLYSVEMRKTVLRVCLKTGRYHDIDAKFDEFSEIVERNGMALKVLNNEVKAGDVLDMWMTEENRKDKKNEIN